MNYAFNKLSVFLLIIFQIVSASASASTQVKISTSDIKCTLILRIISSYKYDNIKIEKKTFHVIKPLPFEDKYLKKVHPLNNPNLEITFSKKYHPKDIDYVSSSKIEPIRREIRGSNFILRSIFGVSKPIFSVRVNGEKAVDAPISDTGIYLVESLTNPNVVFTYHLYVGDNLSTFKGIPVPIKNTNLHLIFPEVAYPISSESNSFLRVENTKKWFQPKELKAQNLEFLNPNNGIDLKLFSLSNNPIDGQNNITKYISFNQIKNYAIKELGARIIHGNYMRGKLEITLPDKIRLDSIKGYSVPGTPLCDWQKSQ